MIAGMSKRYELQTKYQILHASLPLISKKLQTSAYILFFSLLLAYCGVQLIGCGYTTRSLISNSFKTIYITPFVNKIDITQDSYTANKYRVTRPFLETDITKSVVDKFLFDGNLKPTKAESSDLVLKGQLLEFRRDPLRYTNNDEVEEYRISIVVNIGLWDNRENKLIWEENSFVGDTTYFTRGNLAKSEDLAISDAIKDLARRIVERAVEQW
jgi:hypothetical protein